MSVTKRFFFYLMSLVPLGMFAWGAGILITLLFDRIFRTSSVQITGTSYNGQTLSLGLALLIIGGILWYIFWRAVQKAASGNPEETGSALRKWYLYIVLVASLSAAIQSGTQFLTWLIGGANTSLFSAASLAILLVALVIWFYHWHVEGKEGQPTPVARTLRRWYIYIFSFWGLAWVATSVVQLIYQAVVSLPVWGTTISAQFWQTGARESVVGVLLGSVIWYFHWLKFSKSDSDSTLRQVYLYLFTIAGSVIAGLVALITFLDKLFRFGLGDLNSATGAYFQFLGWTIPLILVAAAIWTYHHKVIQEEASSAPQMRFSAERVYSYLVSIIGLGALIAGLIMLFGVLLDLLGNAVSTSPVITSAGWRDLLSMGLAFTIVATPMWIYYWNEVLKKTASVGIEERKSRTRRIYLYLIVAAAIIALAADAINIIYRVLGGNIQSQSGIVVYKDIIWSLQSLIVAVPVFVYHWGVLRHDQKLGAEAPALLQKKIVTLVVPPGAENVVVSIEAKLGFKVKLLKNVSGVSLVVPPSDEEIERISGEIQSAPGDKVMLILDDNGEQIIPYDDK